MTLKRNQIFAMARLAGQVERYHTYPTHQRQSVGEHTWQVMRIWSKLFGPPDTDEFEYLLWHDAGELVTGDPPFPLKANNPELKAIYDRLESRAVADMGGPDVAPDSVRPTTKLRAKICDLIEMYEFGCVEQSMGNAFAAPIVSDTFDAIAAFGGKLTRDDFELVQQYLVTVKRWYLDARPQF